MADIFKILQQAQQMQSKMQEMQEELAQRSVTGTSGGGMVAVEVDGKGTVKKVKLDPTVVNPADVEMLEDLIAIAIALFLAWTSWGVFRASSDQLMDHELPDEDRAKIKSLVMRHADVRNLHDLRTRASGLNTFIQFHIELDADISLTRAHEISDAVEADVMEAFPKAEILIHQDPEGIEMPAPLAKV